jgi:hypothetical protein
MGTGKKKGWSFKKVSPYFMKPEYTGMGKLLQNNCGCLLITLKEGDSWKIG